MSALDVRKVRVLHQWIVLAEDDFMTAKEMMAHVTPRLPKITFFCQQSAEKYLKAWLVFKEFEFPYTHKISVILDLCKSSGGEEWTENIRESEELTKYAVLVRYPLEGEDITVDETGWAIQIAEKVRSTLRAVLKEGIRKEYERQTDEEIRREYEQIELLKE